ncbi:DUF4402 domain-containing protein [Flavobacterium sp. ZE23DGlu08]|uniref:DUF4402 domain-containing protein n=1 Tax=Flavobacterium sp. ZE23DGlu08 TaxID=3059026 RepID=UPI00265D9E80|nr:DUF4402 domain-containing protein [Flavobacterium sp. ZE23DGlu08]WKL43877.1 DUF4402 domain-containing protein [Flavobacterium sp. ZE23DGlu08]
MKEKILLLLLFFLPFTGSLMAQVPISISKNTDMNFGTIAASSGGTVVLSPSGSRTASGGLILPSFIGTVSVAQFTVTGEPRYTYAITLPAYFTLYESGVGPATMVVTAFTSTPSFTGTLSGGTETILVGATLNVSGSQTAGSYTNAAGFEVTVNYN